MVGKTTVRRGSTSHQSGYAKEKNGFGAKEGDAHD
jgi:hypothetical protein